MHEKMFSKYWVDKRGDFMSYSKIFIITDSRSSSGGVESMHQLASQINNLGGKAYIYYRDLGIKTNYDNVPSKFHNYNIQTVNKIEDNEDNLMIVPEIYTSMLYKHNKINKCIWWLSLDFYFDSCSYVKTAKRIVELKKLAANLYPLVAGALWFKRFPNKYFKFGSDKNEIMHFYNCEYIKQYLLNKGIENKNTYYLCGPIRDEYFENKNIVNKLSQVAYNPAKGLEFSEKIINYMKQHMDDTITFIRLTGMKPEEMVETLGKSKVYMDFGYFPGPERIPREAVTMHCNLITSTSGSAANDIDVPIPRTFKFKPKDSNLKNICENIQELVNNYDEHVNKYDSYRVKVRNQKNLFNQTIYRLFKN